MFRVAFFHYHNNKNNHNNYYYYDYYNIIIAMRLCEFNKYSYTFRKAAWSSGHVTFLILDDGKQSLRHPVLVDL